MTKGSAEDKKKTGHKRLGVFDLSTLVSREGQQERGFTHTLAFYSKERDG